MRYSIGRSEVGDELEERVTAANMRAAASSMRVNRSWESHEAIKAPENAGCGVQDCLNDDPSDDRRTDLESEALWR